MVSSDANISIEGHDTWEKVNSPSVEKSSSPPISSNTESLMLVQVNFKEPGYPDAVAFADPSYGKACTVFRDEQGPYHVTTNDHSSYPAGNTVRMVKIDTSWDYEQLLHALDKNLPVPAHKSLVLDYSRSGFIHVVINMVCVAWNLPMGMNGSTTIDADGVNDCSMVLGMMQRRGFKDILVVSYIGK